MQRTLAQTVQALREQRGYSQEELAARAEVSRSTIQNLESGRRATRPAALRRIARALGTDFMTLRNSPDGPSLADLRRMLNDALASDDVAAMRELLADALEQINVIIEERGGDA